MTSPRSGTAPPSPEPPNIPIPPSHTTPGGVIATPSITPTRSISPVVITTPIKPSMGLGILLSRGIICLEAVAISTGGSRAGDIRWRGQAEGGSGGGRASSINTVTTCVVGRGDKALGRCGAGVIIYLCDDVSDERHEVPPRGEVRHHLGGGDVKVLFQVGDEFSFTPFHSFVVLLHL